jgi:uncharacterized membrane protein
MESRAKLAGHAIHPMLVVFPLGLLATAVIFDVLYLFTGNAGFATVAYWNITGGVLGGLAAAVFGLWDWLGIPSGTRAWQIGLWHGLGNAVVISLFALSWYQRANAPGQLPSTTAFVLALLAIGLAVVTGWLGGELVDRLGVGIDEGANLNAPSSLSGEPANRHVAR